MNRTELQNKKDTLARLIEGRSIQDKRPIQVCLKGTVLGFPATLEAMNVNWPFGVNYFIETHLIDNPSKAELEPLKLTINPRIVSGLVAWFTRKVLLFGTTGQPINDRKLMNKFTFTYNDRESADKFLEYPGIHETLVKLHQLTNFSELYIKTDSGLHLAQPISFASLHPDMFKATFRALADLGQILFETF